MKAIDIHLPGSGQHQSLFSFNLMNPMPDGLINLPVLSSPQIENWQAPGPVQACHLGRFHGHQSAEYQFLHASVKLAGQNIREVTHSLYDELLRYLDAFPQLVRCWNYLPDINEGIDDNENYRQFCWGRADALENNPIPLPAATAIGSRDGQIRLSALSAKTSVRVEHMENPRQVSAFHYPRQYGPRSPLFARSTRIYGESEQLLLVSGTASIVDHKSQHRGDIGAQTAETHRNIQRLLSSVVAPVDPSNRDAGQAPWEPLCLRYYLRNKQDLRHAQQAYHAAFPGLPEPVFIQGDICRAELAMEVEGVWQTRAI